MAMDDDPLKFGSDEPFGQSVAEAQILDWTDIVQDTLNAAYRNPSGVNPEMIRQLEVALSAIVQHSNSAPSASRNQGHPRSWDPDRQDGLD
jgi:hypothetical protein